MSREVGNFRTAVHFKITIFNCPKPEENGSTEEDALFTASPLNLQNSADGIDFSGSETIEGGTSTTTLEWSFHGTE